MRFVNVLLPLALDNLFTYQVNEEWQNDVAFGKRVTIHFNKKIYSALIVEIIDDVSQLNNSKYKIKSIIEIIDTSAIITKTQYKLWQWMSNYYCCTLGEVMQAAMPSGLKLTSETQFLYNHEQSFDWEQLSNEAYILGEAFQLREQLSIQEISLILENRKVLSTVKKLIDAKIIYVKEELKHKYKEKQEDYITLHDSYANENGIEKAFELVKRSKKQENLITAYIQLSNYFTATKNEFVKKTTLITIANADNASLNKLVEKQVFIKVPHSVSRLSLDFDKVEKIELSVVQQLAYNQITENSKSTKAVTLLHGVTGSGKTNIYAKKIQEQLNAGRQVLYLVPEIALTTQLITRLRKLIGFPIGVYHSKFNENERVETWNNLLESKSIRFIVGARSAVFLPFTDLSLVIIDEEHESSYKQQDPAPRYHARDTGIVLANYFNAQVILGSATPSVETYFNVTQKKYEYVALTERFHKAALPTIEILDLKNDMRLRNMRGPLCYNLFKQTEVHLQEKKQILFFQNRRGYVPRHQCMTCGYVPSCTQCDVSLTYHKKINLLKCHYCGYTEKLSATCINCNSTNIVTQGQGTEKIEEELNVLFSESNITRIDSDTTRGKNAITELFEAINNKKTDIIVGTQMIAKGLDFEGVDLVGILNADETILFPDFRANEKAFQLFCQVAGRAGRKSGNGKIFIQTTQPQFYLFDLIKEYDFNSFFAIEIKDRKNFNYPPFSRLIKVSVQHRDVAKLNIACDEMKNKLLPIFGTRLVGPEFPLIARIKNKYTKQFLLKIGRNENQVEAKKTLQLQLNEFKIRNTSFYIIIDVDTY